MSRISSMKPLQSGQFPLLTQSSLEQRRQKVWPQGMKAAPLCLTMHTQHVYSPPLLLVLLLRAHLRLLFLLLLLPELPEQRHERHLDRRLLLSALRRVLVRVVLGDDALPAAARGGSRPGGLVRVREGVAGPAEADPVLEGLPIDGPRRIVPDGSGSGPVHLLLLAYDVHEGAGRPGPLLVGGGREEAVAGLGVVDGEVEADLGPLAGGLR
ncbi:pre-mRNA-splicing factor cwc24-like [Iris pallida]|uniref:Pre-mRNA-splicing factor cwc24-like n=1 Tax=Iris pallida TaxID=29817 RepID=A0AAX6H6M4_IRIPA|nr:pre-mRNA-splicing factor cwc24-like [Iris pallida]